MPNYKDGSDIKRPGIINRERRLDYSDKDGELLSTASPDATTATNKEWGKGSLEVNEEGAFFTPPPGGTPVGPGEDTVEGRLTGLLKKGSLYRTAAEADAVSRAKERGLQNTTMAVTAGTRAAIESGLPIAAQDAGFLQESKLLAQQGEIQEGLYETQGDISSDLSAQGFEQEGGLLSQRGELDKSMATQKFEQDKQLNAIELEWKKLDLQTRADIDYAHMDEDNRARFDKTYNTISESYIQDYMEILANPDWATSEDRQEAIRILNTNTQTRFDAAAVVAQVELTWAPPEEGKKTSAEIEAEKRRTKTISRRPSNAPSPGDYQNFGGPI